MAPHAKRGGRGPRGGYGETGGPHGEPRGATGGSRGARGRSWEGVEGGGAERWGAHGGARPPPQQGPRPRLVHGQEGGLEGRGMYPAGPKMEAERHRSYDGPHPAVQSNQSLQTQHSRNGYREVVMRREDSDPGGRRRGGNETNTWRRREEEARIRGEQQAVSREARVGTNPRGREPVSMGGARQVEDLPSTGFSNRNQFDRASQLRRSKKRKKSKDSASTLPRSPSKEATSPKTATEIVRQETTGSTKSLGRREPGMRKATSMVVMGETSLENHSLEHHSKYGNLI